MRIVHIIPFYGEQHGGSERYVHNLVKHQIKKHDVHIFSTTRLFENRGCIEQEGYTLHRFYSPAVVWNINPICFILHRLAGFEADIIHIHSYLYFSSIQAIFSKRLNQVPMLLHLHGGVGIPPYQTSLIKKSAKIFYDRFIGSYILKNADMIASVSKTDILRAKRTFGEKHADKFIYIPNGVDISLFNSTKRNFQTTEKTKILYVGDMEHWKGIDYLIRTIVNDDVMKDRNIEFNFIGKGSLVPKLKELQLKRKDIQYLGEKQHNHIPKIMKTADLFVFPSLWEGSPTVVLEAMSTGLPVISTPVGDVPMIIKHRENGIIFRHNRNELIQSIQLLEENVGLKTKISRAAAHHVRENYDFSKIASMTEAAYEGLISY